MTLVAGAAAWPFAARAQQSNTVRRLGVLMNFRADEPEGQARVRAFTQGLQKLGWSEGGNGNVIDPVGGGFVSSLARPGGNTTGFIAFEYSLAGKWVELLKEIAPNVTRVAVLRDPTYTAGIGQFAAIQSTAPSIGVDLSVIDARDAGEIERAIAAFADEPNGGLIPTVGVGARYAELITALAIRYRLPSVYGLRFYTAGGGLASYGPDASDNFSRAAVYVDRILNGEKPANLPVQAPTKYELEQVPSGLNRGDSPGAIYEGFYRH